MNIKKNRIKEIILQYMESYREWFFAEEESAPSGEYDEYNVDYLRICDEQRCLEKVLNTLGITMDYYYENYNSEENYVNSSDYDYVDFYLDGKLIYTVFSWKKIFIEYF